MNKRKIIYIVLILVLLAIFTISAIYVVRYFAESKEQQAKFNDLASMVENIQAQNSGSQSSSPSVSYTVDPDTGETIPVAVDPSELVMLPEYAALYELNDDIVGWIKIDGTPINYPVMQTPDYVDYYLKRDFNEKSSSRGCIYVREQCNVFEPSDNLTIYGHNMNDGSMFNSLSRYQHQSNWEANSYITFDTLYEHHTYQIFAVFKTSANVGKGFTYHLFVDAENEAEFDEFIATCKELAFYDTGITPKYGDKIICLSTCEYTQSNGRLVVCAVRIS